MAGVVGVVGVGDVGDLDFANLAATDEVVMNGFDAGDAGGERSRMSWTWTWASVVVVGASASAVMPGGLFSVGIPRINGRQTLWGNQG